MNKKTFRRFAVVAVLAIAAPVPAQDAKSIDAGKKEGGKVIVYSSMESSISDGIAAAFKKKTGLEMEYWRGSSTKVLDRALSEHRAGKPLFDVAITIADPMFLMQSEGVFAKYDSPSAADYPKSLIDPNLGPNYRTLLIGIVYNKNSIKPADAPKSFEDLVKPQFKGKLIMPDPTQHTTTTQWVASLPKLLGKERAEKFVRELAATRPILAESLLPPVERAVSGECRSQSRSFIIPMCSVRRARRWITCACRGCSATPITSPWQTKRRILTRARRSSIIFSTTSA